MSDARICVALFLKVLQLVGDLACFATSIKAGGHYNGLIIAVTVFSFIYNIFSNCLGWFGMKGTVDTEDVRAYRQFVLGGGTLFFLFYIGSSIFQLFTGYNNNLNNFGYGSHLKPYHHYASWCIGVTCAVLYCMQVIMCECWGITFASVHDLSTGFFERQPFKFACLVFSKSKAAHDCEDNNDIGLESMQHNTSNNTGTNTKSS